MSRVARSGLLLLFAAVAFLVSCRREAPSNIDRNQAPETYIRRAPAESTLTYYRAHFYWSGADPDGQIAYYEIAVTDSNEAPGDRLEEGSGYTRTLASDSVFVLASGRPIEQQIQGKRLYVRAVDNEGKVDPTPARAFFQARNDYYPEVLFNPGIGGWTTKCQTPFERVLTSTNRNEPTDTLGVGATVTWTWSGRDRDPQGFITGFVYKLESQPLFRGGTLADTTITITFPRNAARRQVLTVRAIDDGGLRSSTDFTASVVLNFDPLTFTVVPPEDVNNPPAVPRFGRVFRQGVQVYPSGTTLPDRRYDDIDIFFTGLDDPRDAGDVCDNAGIKRYQGRTLYREDSDLSAGGQPFFDLQATAAYPTVNMRTEFQKGSGDWIFLTRAVDDLNVFDSTPETLVVGVNYRPYIVEFTARAQTTAPSGAINLLGQSPNAEPVIRLSKGEALVVTLKGSDYHKVSPARSGMGPQDSLAFLYDTNQVVGDETNTGLHPNEAYRVYVIETEPFPPGFDPAPAGDAPYTVLLDFPASGVYTLNAGVRDRTVTAPNGRTGTQIRKVRIQFDN